MKDDTPAARQIRSTGNLGDGALAPELRNYGEIEVRGPRPLGCSIKHRAKPRQTLLCGWVVRLFLQGFPEFLCSCGPLAFGFIGPREVRVRKAVAFVPRRFKGAQKPRNGVIDLAFLQQIRANVVVRVSEGRIGLNRLVAFRDRANMLFRNSQGVFADAAVELGVADTRKSVGAVWFDYERDGDLDLYVANQDGDANGFFRNDGGHFTDIAESIGLQWGGRAAGLATQGTVRPCVADMDNDGIADIITANYGPNGLFLGASNGTFRDVSRATGLAIDGRYDTCAPADIDHDGRLDLYVNGTVSATESFRDYLFSRRETAFVDVTPPNVLALTASHGVQWADVDGDGALDLLLAGSRPEASHPVLRNVLPATLARRSLQVRVLDENGRATQAGAEVRVYAAGQRRMLATRYVDAGSGYNAQSDMPLHFGLKSLDAVDVEVTTLRAGKRVITTIKRVSPAAYAGRALIVRAPASR